MPRWRVVAAAGAVTVACTVAPAVTSGSAPARSAAPAKAWESIDPIPAGEVQDGLYVRRIRASIVGVATRPGSATITLDPAEPIDGNGVLAGHVPTMAPLCMNRPVLLDPDPFGGPELAFATELARHQGVGVDGELSAHAAFVFFQAPEWSRYRDFGDDAFDAMLIRLYGQRLGFPSVRTMLAAGDGPAHPGPNAIACRVFRDPTPAYRAAFHAAADRPGLTVVDDMTRLGPGDYFLAPGVVPAYIYQYLRLNRSAPTVHTLPASGPIANLKTAFWVDPAAYPVSRVQADVTGGNPVIIQAVPHLQVTMPDGTVVTCKDLGSPVPTRQDPACGGLFEQAGPARVHARVLYRVSWEHTLRGRALESDLRTGDQSALGNQVLDVGEVQVAN